MNRPAAVRAFVTNLGLRDQANLAADVLERHGDSPPPSHIITIEDNEMVRVFDRDEQTKAIGEADQKLCKYGTRICKYHNNQPAWVTSKRNSAVL